jgi:hypothetical protein
MLIGRIFEATPQVTAAENIATRLADRIRNLWLEHVARGEHCWEDNFFEDPDGIVFLRDESFPLLQGIDYIFRWWGNKDDEGLAGDLEVLWKIRFQEEMHFYKTTIRFAAQDFPLHNHPKGEDEIREAFKVQFRHAFTVWQKLYTEELSRLGWLQTNRPNNQE